MGSSSILLSATSSTSRGACAGRDAVTSSPSNATCTSLSQSDIITVLGQSASYGIDMPVVRLDMVEAILFFAGPYCYKLFCEQHTSRKGIFDLEQRRAIALEELKLGQAFSPGQYQAVVPVYQSGVDVTLGNPIQSPTHQSLQASEGLDGPVVEWLLQMQRFDPSSSYDKRVAHHRPNFRECGELATEILTAHQVGSADHERNWVGEMDQTLDRFLPFVRRLHAAKDRCKFHACLMRAKARLDQLAPHLRQRQRLGMVRTIHGNLRLSNMLRMSDGLRLVHPVARMDGPAVGEPLFDLAALLSELWSQGLRQQANWVFSHYCNDLQDEDLLASLDALDLYLFLRSFEQAHFLCQAMQESSKPDIQPYCSCGQRKDQRSLLSTASASLLQDETMLLVLGGGTAEDRSQLTRMISPMIGRLPGAISLTMDGKRANWQAKARYALQSGYCVILDAGQSCQTDRMALKTLSDQIADATNGSEIHHASQFLFWLGHHPAPSLAGHGWFRLDPAKSNCQLLYRILSCVNAGSQPGLPALFH